MPKIREVAFKHVVRAHIAVDEHDDSLCSRACEHRQVRHTKELVKGNRVNYKVDGLYCTLFESNLSPRSLATCVAERCADCLDNECLEETAGDDK
jgi:hypothetical protein